MSDIGAGSSGATNEDRPLLSPSAHDSGAEVRTPPATEHEPQVFRHTRTSAAWVATAVAVVFGIALIDFIAQNTRHVRIEFFGVSGKIPIAVALLAAAVAGAIVVLAIGVARVVQLRLTMRRQRKLHRGRKELERSPRE